MNRGGVWLMLILICAVSLTAEDIPRLLTEGETVLSGDWSWRYRLPDGTLQEWHSATLPHRFDPPEVEYPELMLRFDFYVPPELAEERLFLMLGKRWGPVQVFINNVEILRSGSFYPDYHYHEARRVNSPIPEGLLRYGRINRILIRFGHERDRTLVKPPTIGFSDDYWFRERVTNFINVDLYRYLAFLSLFVAIFFLMQYAVRPKDRNNLMFALVNIGLTIYMLRLGYSFPGLPVTRSYGISKAVFFPSITLMTAFTAGYLNAPGLRRLMPLFWVTSAASFIAMSFFGDSSLDIDTFFSFSLIPVAVEVVLMGVISVGAYRRGNPDAPPMLVGVVLGGLISFHDIIYMVLRVYPNWWIQGVGIFAFDMGVFASLAIRSMRIHSELERYSEMIEQKVLDRTRELQRANQDLHDAMEAARHASQAKSRFLANISHEMRTPLNCIIGFSEMISRNVDGTERRNVGVVLNESERLLTLINQLLDIEKIEAGKVSLDSAPFSLAEFVEGVTHSFAVNCAEKGLDWKVEIAEGTPDKVEADSFRLRQVLDNLISNAVKFTSRGGISLKIETVGETVDGETVLRFTVKDSGIGISAEQSQLIFESFEQGDSSRTRLYGGTGLGTTIAKQLVTLMEGDIGVESEVGKGSEFWFTLPCRIPAEAEIAPPGIPLITRSGPAVIEGDRLILVAEDYAPNRIIARTHLESAGCRVVEAANGREAVELSAREPIDMILMDIQMPDMDGLEATRYIRRSLGKSAIPILGLTANAFPEELKLYREAGMDGVMIKPIRRESFLAEVAAWLAGEDRIVDRRPARSGPNGELVCDLPALTSELDGNREQALLMLTDFADALRNQIGVIETALENGDWETLHRELHSIKGGALNLFADRLAGSASAAEAAAKGRELKGVRERLPGMFEEIRRFFDHVAGLEQRS